MNSVIITSDKAADMARSLRDTASNCYQHGTLTEFMRGMLQGQMIMIRCYMLTEKWVLQGIENELDFYCRCAQQAEMGSP